VTLGEGFAGGGLPHLYRARIEVDCEDTSPEEIQPQDAIDRRAGGRRVADDNGVVVGDCEGLDRVHSDTGCLLDAAPGDEFSPVIWCFKIVPEKHCGFAADHRCGRTGIHSKADEKLTGRPGEPDGNDDQAPFWIETEVQRMITACSGISPV